MFKVFILLLSLYSLCYSDLQYQCFNKKDGRSCHQLGKKYLKSSPSLSLRAYQEGSRLKDTESMKYMGYLYWNDQYQSNKLIGIKLLEQVANRKQYKEAAFLGSLYARGVAPVRQDFKKAEKYLLMAALINKKLNSVPLAKFYEGKYGNTADLQKSNMWYDIAANHGNQDIMFLVAQWNQDGTHGYKKNPYIAQRLWNLLSASGVDKATKKLKEYNYPITYVTPVKYKEQRGF